jgi:condensin complex subunit 1
MSTRLTYEASLAELTSLEELLRTMMLDNRIHPDVIKKLWQVYSKYLSYLLHGAKLIFCAIGSDKPLSRQQRRGAIMILGMLAVAKREVVTDHVDILLKIGLGQLGKACG